MLSFFRKNQKIVFIAIIAVTVTTIVFFGSYQAFTPSHHQQKENPVVFQTSGGAKVHHLPFEILVRLLDTESWMGVRYAMQGNFLNDGIVLQDFLQSGLAEELLAAAPSLFREELLSRLEKEKSYTPYIHPHVGTINARSVWEVFAPDIGEKLDALQKGGDLSLEEGFKARIALLCSQLQCPPTLLTQILHYHEREYTNMPQDPRLQREEISLFGYRTLQDWLGPTFLRVAAYSIFELAQQARRHGYGVTLVEAEADLLRRSQEACDVLRKREGCPFQTGEHLLAAVEQKQGIPHRELVRVWQNVLLFRRLLQDIGHVALPDALPFEAFSRFAGESCTLAVKQMAPEFRLKTFEDLVAFETYVAAMTGENVPHLTLPEHFLPLEKIKIQTPELVGKRYLLSVAKIQKKALAASITVKETWQWEGEEAHWPQLKEAFPELSQKSGSSLAVLETLSPARRQKVDNYVREEILRAHPNRLEEALLEAKTETRDLFLHPSYKECLPGITDPVAFQHALSQADLLPCYSQDGEHYFRIEVVHRGEEEALSFREARQYKGLEALSERLGTKGRAETMIRLLASAYPHVASSWEDQKKLLPAYRFADFLRACEGKEESLSSPWRWENLHKTVSRAQPGGFPFAQLLRAQEGEVLGIHVDPFHQDLSHLTLLEKHTAVNWEIEPLLRIEDKISRKAKKAFFHYALEGWLMHLVEVIEHLPREGAC